MSMDLGRVVRFTNITSQDFTHAYNGQPFTIKAGTSQMFPHDLGRHLAKHLARKIIFSGADKGLLTNDRSIITETEEEKLIEKILSDDFRMEVPEELSEAERIRQRVEELNQDKPDEAPTNNKTKADVIAELEAKGVSVDRKLSKAELERQLA